MMVHGVTPGPLLIQQDPQLFWGFIASMYVGNVILLDPEPAAGRALREPAARAVPGAVPDRSSCARSSGVYAVNGSVVDVWIMLAMGVLGLRAAQARLRDRADRAGAGAGADDGAVASASRSRCPPAATRSSSPGPSRSTLLAIGAVLVVLALRPLISRTIDWRARLPVDT